MDCSIQSAEVMGSTYTVRHVVTTDGPYTEVSGAPPGALLGAVGSAAPAQQQQQQQQQLSGLLILPNGMDTPQLHQPLVVGCLSPLAVRPQPPAMFHVVETDMELARTSSALTSPHGAKQQAARKPAPSQLFRLRQKELISTLEREILDKLGQLEQLKEQNVLLRLRNTVLEGAVSGRDDQISIMTRSTALGSPRQSSSCSSRDEELQQQPAAAERDASGPGAPEPPLRQASAGGAAHGDASPLTSLQQMDAASAGGSSGDRGVCWWQRDGPVAYSEVEATTQDDLKRLLREYVDRASVDLVALQKEEERWWREGEDGGGGCGGGSGSGCSGEWEDRSGPLDLEADGAGCAGMGWHGGARSAAGGPWGSDDDAVMAAAAEAGGAAGAAGGGPAAAGAGAPGGEIHDWSFYTCNELPQGLPPGSARARIRSVVNRYSGAIKLIYVLLPGVMIPLMGTNLETGERMQPVPDSLWRGVVKQLKLTQRQRQVILAIDALYSRYMESVMAERSVLQAKLGDAHRMAEGIRSSNKSFDNHDMVTNSTLRTTTVAMEATEGLAANMKKEHAINMLLVASLFRTVFDEVQMARAVVYSYPLIADAHSIVKAVKESGE